MKKYWVVGAMGAIVSISGCGGGGCTTDIRPAIALHLVTEGASLETQCSAQVIAYRDDGSVTYAEGYSSKTAENQLSCSFSIAEEQIGTYTVEAKLQGFDTVMLEGIEVTGDSCHPHTVTITETLVPAVANCHDGYEWVNDACNTPNGCTFPKLEQAVVPGIQEAEVTYDCVDSCTFTDGFSFESPESPGRCASLSLPALPPQE